ncbi:hypothetical protein QBC39DRAFT_35589 [Podospora conica]|nr:hypothetical protein QBC39DRAFT_35589 [Schizothecium conicum]
MARRLLHTTTDRPAGAFFFDRQTDRHQLSGRSRQFLATHTTITTTNHSTTRRRRLPPSADPATTEQKIYKGVFSLFDCFVSRRRLSPARRPLPVARRLSPWPSSRVLPTRSCVPWVLVALDTLQIESFSFASGCCRHTRSDSGCLTLLADEDSWKSSRSRLGSCPCRAVVVMSASISTDGSQNLNIDGQTQTVPPPNPIMCDHRIFFPSTRCPASSSVSTTTQACFPVSSPRGDSAAFPEPMSAMSTQIAATRTTGPSQATGHSARTTVPSPRCGTR